MKIHAIILTLVALAFACAPAKLNAQQAGQQGGYSANLITPKAGDILIPGQRVKVQWTTSISRPIDLAYCEAEVWLSLDGGNVYSMCITPIMDPQTRFFYWTVPNTPTKTAVLDIRFGCEGWWPESFSPQTASMFQISNVSAQLY
jgi:hypothetical protein